MSEDRFIMAAIDDEAADWLVRRDAGLEPHEEVEFQDWLAADPRHGMAFARVQGALARLDRPRQEGFVERVVAEVAAAERHTARARAGSFRSLVAWSGLAACLALALGVNFYRSRNVDAPATVAATKRLNPERQQLPDGSLVELNANSEIAVDYSPERRGIRLLRGEAHFAVLKDPARPFVVSVGNVEVRAVGTAFAVRLEPTKVDVLVTEGRVAVASAPLAGTASSVTSSSVPEPVYVSAGGRVAVPVAGLVAAPPAIEVVDPTEMDSALAWRRARFEFTNTPFPEAIELYNRKSELKLVLDDPTLASEQVSGIYWINDAASFARMVENTHGLVATHEGENRIVLRRRR